jgi:SIR2-like domain
MKKKLLVILGAGSSSALGLPSVKCLDRLMAQWGIEWANQHGATDHFQELWQSAETYYEHGPTGLGPALNFEKVLGDMVAMAHWMEPPPWGDTLKQAACGGAPPPQMKFRYHQERKEEVAEVPLLPNGLVCDENDMRGGECEVTGESSVEVEPRPEVEPIPDHAEGDWKGKYGAHIELMGELSFLLEKLAQHMRRLCQRFDPATAAAERYRRLLGGLREKFDVGVYNLNYDTAALDALPGAYTGFGDTGTFESSIIAEKSHWDFVYHLHGSVHHSFNHRFGDEICWRRSLDEGFFDGSEGRSSDKRSEGRSFPITTLVAGGFKLDQLLVEPFHSLHAALVRHVYGADAILIGGYGFGDVHINRALRNRIGGRNTRVPVMILDRAAAKTDPMAFRSDMWAVELCSALCANGHFFAEPGHSSPPVPTDLVKRDAFEVDAEHRVALWHGGFVEAERRVSAIAQWLDGMPDGVLIPGSAK